jgi:glycosyltransferase involved in cell wall biosynthesis
MNKMDNKNGVPLASLVTGCYNGEKFIERAFNSILKQTYTNLELIFVNDGSIDNSLALAKSYTSQFNERGIVYKIIDQENQGFYPTSGIKQTSGKYIATLDIDDYLMPDSIKKRVLFLEENNDYGGVRSNGYEVKEGALEDCSKLFVVKEEEKNNEYIFEDLLHAKTNNWAGTYMVRASVLFMYYPDHIVPGHDFGQNLQILMPAAFKNKVGFIDEPLMKYIRHSESFTLEEITYESRLRMYQGFKEIREFMLGVLGVKSQEVFRKLDQTYYTFYLDIAYNFRKINEFNLFYKKIDKKTISNKIKYHRINNNVVKQYYYRILNLIILKFSN